MHVSLLEPVGLRARRAIATVERKAPGPASVIGSVPMLRAALALALFSGCTCQEERAPAPEPPADEHRPDAPRPAEPIPAFLVYGPSSTEVVPVDGAPVRRADGIWAATPDAPRTVVHRVVPTDGAASVGLRACACGTIAGACLDEPLTRTIYVDADFRVEWAPACPCWAEREHTGWPELPFYTDDEDGERAGPCRESRQVDPALSMVSGRLYTSSWSSEMNEPCASPSRSLNAYDLWGDERVLVEVSLRDRPSEGATYGCAEALFHSGLGLDDLPACEDELTDDRDDPCCRDRVDFTFPLLRNGLWCEVATGVGVAGNASTCARCVRASPEACPSALDPCGDAAPYRAATDEADLFWVSTDGEQAFLRGDSGAEVRTRAGSSHPVEIASEEIIGVLFHPDASGILAAMERDLSVPEAGAPAPCRADSACEGGQLCMNGACLPRCAADDDCDIAGQCGARCEDGRCGPIPDGRCSDVFPCAEGYRCSAEGACDPEGEGNEGADECASDADCGSGMCVGDPPRCQGLPCDDERTPSARADACSRERRAGDTASASTTCRCALEAAEDPRTRGALLYELGRIAEANGERGPARRYYERSLEARPNRVVQERLDGLAP